MLGIRNHSFSSSVILHLRVFPCISVCNAARAPGTGQCVYFAFFRFIFLLNRFLFFFVHSSPLVNASCGTLDCLQLHLARPTYKTRWETCQPLILFFLIFLQTTISFPLVILLPHQLPAPEGQSPAA